MLPIQDSNFATNSIYAGMFAETSRLTNSIITNPDFTGLSFAQDSLRANLLENTAKDKSISKGISAVQAVDFAAATIGSKVDRMKILATWSASGDYTSSEVKIFQSEFNSLANDINNLSVTTAPGGNHFLNKDSGSVAIDVGDSLSINVNTTVMTVSGLGVINSVDLTNDPAAVLVSLEAASSKIGAYSAHLKAKAKDLRTSLKAVESQRDGLLAAKSVTEGIVEAMALSVAMNEGSSALANMLAIAQANLDIEMVIDLLTADANE